MADKKFILGKEPFIRKADNQESTSQKMLDFIIALTPLILFAWVKNGLLPYLDGNTNFLGLIYPLLLVVVGGLTSTLLEMGWYKFIIKDEPLMERMKKSYAPIPGLLLGMIVPLSTPIWVLIFGAFFATVIAKLIYGGFGHNLFNPALVGYLFIMIAYASLTVAAENPTSFGALSFLNANEIVAGATPLSQFHKDMDLLPTLIADGKLLNMFFGFRAGSLAETSGLLCLIGLVYMLFRRVTTWKIPVAYLATVFVLTLVIGLANGYGLEFPLFQLFNGGLMFGAVFMATEPVTSPRNPNGKLLYGIFIGVLTVVFRFASSAAEGVCYSILIMNMFTPIIERVSAKLRVEPNKRKAILTYVFIGLMILGISAFPVASAFPSNVSVEYTGKEQNKETLDFVYTFTVKDQTVNVTTDQTYKIKKVNVADFNTDEYKELFGEAIKANKFTVYVTKAVDGLDTLTVTVLSKGYSGNITAEIDFDNANVLTAFRILSQTESYQENPEWSGIDAVTEMPGRIVAGKDNLDAVETVSGATVTSRALIAAAKCAKDYATHLSTLTGLAYTGSRQDMDTLNFIYVFRNSGQKLNVIVDKNYQIISDVDASIKADMEAAIAQHKISDYIESRVTENGTTTVVVKTAGYSGLIVTTTVTITGNQITAVSSDTSNQTYAEEYNTGWNGQHPNVVLPDRILAGQDDLSSIEVVAGATYTSHAIINAAKLALEALNE